MKEKKHISPFQILWGLFMFSGFSAGYLVWLLSFYKDGFDIFMTIAAIAGLAFFVLSIIFAVMGSKSRTKYGDEYTSRILQKSGFICFRVILFLITLMFIVVSAIGALYKNGHESLLALLSAQMILSLVASIQILMTFVFALLVYIFGKKGIKA